MDERGSGWFPETAAPRVLGRPVPRQPLRLSRGSGLLPQRVWERLRHSPPLPCWEQVRVECSHRPRTRRSTEKDAFPKHSLILERAPEPDLHETSLTPGCHARVGLFREEPEWPSRFGAEAEGSLPAGPRFGGQMRRRLLPSASSMQCTRALKAAPARTVAAGPHPPPAEHTLQV